MSSNKTDVELRAEGANISPVSNYDFDVTLEGVLTQDLIDAVSVEEFVNGNDPDDILEYVDIQNVIAYYGQELVDEIKSTYGLKEEEE